MVEEMKLWLLPEQLQAINGSPKILSLLYDLNLLPEVVMTHMRAAVKAERDRCEEVVNEALKHYHEDLFPKPESGQHGESVDSCSAAALRAVLPGIAADIRDTRIRRI